MFYFLFIEWAQKDRKGNQISPQYFLFNPPSLFNSGYSYSALDSTLQSLKIHLKVIYDYIYFCLKTLRTKSKEIHLIIALSELRQLQE